MPVVEKTGGGRVYIRPLDQRFEVGDQADVDAEMVAYLTEERGDFEVVDGGESADQEDEPPDEGADADSEDDVEICGVEKSDGDECDRPADECPSHGDGQED